MEMQHRWGTSTKRLEVATYLDRKYGKHETESDSNNKMAVEACSDYNRSHERRDETIRGGETRIQR